jgi:hypothetical protein
MNYFHPHSLHVESGNVLAYCEKQTFILRYAKPSKALVILCGLVVRVLATGKGFAGSNPAEGDGFLRTIKIRSTPSFGGKVYRWTHIVKI